MAYIIESYNRWDKFDREQSRYRFMLNGNWYAIKEVGLNWGVPQLPMRVDEDREREAQFMHVYSTMEEAMEYVELLRRLNAR